MIIRAKVTLEDIREEAGLLGLQQAGYLLAEKEDALLKSLKKIDKNFIG